MRIFGAWGAYERSPAVAQPQAAAGEAQPNRSLPRAHAVAACRVVHLEAVRAILAGEDPATVAARHPARIRSVLTAVGQMTS
jgi:hypothetical protein